MTKSTTLKDWIEAFRLRTLPLALASVVLGSLLALADGQFRWIIFRLALITTVFLQILANLANDYGDTLHGADTAERIGPQRGLQSGAITPAKMRIAIGVFVLLSSLTGVGLIVAGTGGTAWGGSAVFVVLGLGALAAAIKYTIGKRPYGYAGYGDLFVFLFFGLIGVIGTYYLHTHRFYWSLLLPAGSIGLLSVGVLNINNMRDHLQDAKAGKRTVVVKIGFPRAKIYHLGLILSAIILSIIFISFNYSSSLKFLFLIIAPVMIRHAVEVFRLKEPEKLDPYLKKLAINTFLFALLLGVSVNL